MVSHSRLGNTLKACTSGQIISYRSHANIELKKDSSPFILDLDRLYSPENIQRQT